MKLLPPDTRQHRTLGAVFLITLMTATLVTTYFETQVVHGPEYALRSEENRLRPVVIPAPRGSILDRNGAVVATSIPGYSILLLPASEAVVRSTLEDLAPFIGLAEGQIQQLLQRRAQRPNDLLPVASDATFSQVAMLEERLGSFPNLLVIDQPKRYYPAGAALGHLVGYVAEISPQELALPVYRDAGYRQGRWVGKAGLEKEYELRLSGKDGARFVEVDAHGRVVNPHTVIGTLQPKTGDSITLTLDLALQQYVRYIFPDTMSGAVVAMVPATGEVLAIYSNPGYDPNDFVGAPSASLWRALNSDSLKPLLDRAIYATYPPGSTWKLATATAGLHRGVITRTSFMPIPCTGGMAYAGRYARCWSRAGHGYLNLPAAIEKSCDVYFYQVGIRLGLQRLATGGTRMGFNSKSGIDLPGERRPDFPPELNLISWWKQHFGYSPQPSEVMGLAIGQGPNSQTVLRMAEFYSALAGSGVTARPHLLASDEPPDTSLVLPLAPKDLLALWEGLARVTEAQGTALQSSLARYKLYGKTGTSQNPHGPDHGWFVGFAGVPGGQPEIVVAAIVEHGLHGDATAPLVAKIANYYLDRKHGYPYDPEPTLGERWRAEKGGTAGQFDVPGRRLVPLGMSAAVAAPSSSSSARAHSARARPQPPRPPRTAPTPPATATPATPPTTAVPNAPVPNAPVPNAPVPNAPVPNAPVPNAPVPTVVTRDTAGRWALPPPPHPDTVH